MTQQNTKVLLEANLEYKKIAFKAVCISFSRIFLALDLSKKIVAKKMLRNAECDPLMKTGDEYESYKAREILRWDEKSEPNVSDVPLDFRYKQQALTKLMISFLLLAMCLSTLLSKLRKEILKDSSRVGVDIQSKISAIDQRENITKSIRINQAFKELPRTELEQALKDVNDRARGRGNY